MRKYLLLIVVLIVTSNFAYANKVIKCDAYKKGSNLNPISAVIIHDNLKDNYEVRLNNEVHNYKWKQKDGSYRGKFSSNIFYLVKDKGGMINPDYEFRDCK